jgi:indole-3-glycerol phosphate synthase
VRHPRRFSQAISEGDGISIIVAAGDADTARAAEADGAEAILVRGHVEGMREATTLPILWCVPGATREAHGAEADAFLLVYDDLAGDAHRLEELHDEVVRLGLDCVVDVRSDEDLQAALERIDPEIFLLSGGGDDREALDRVLELLQDVPAGKLAVAEVPDPGRAEVDALERAGFDAVVVEPGSVAELAGGAPPAV